MAHNEVVRSGSSVVVAAGIAASKGSKTDAGWVPTQWSYREHQHKRETGATIHLNTGSLLSKPNTVKSISCFYLLLLLREIYQCVRYNAATGCEIYRYTAGLPSETVDLQWRSIDIIEEQTKRVACM